MTRIGRQPEPGAAWRGENLALIAEFAIDDLLCRGGLEEMMAGIEAGRTKQVPTPPDQIGKAIVVDPPPDYAPKFVAPETYKPMQAKARSEIRSDLLKMLQ